MEDYQQVTKKFSRCLSPLALQTKKSKLGGALAKCIIPKLMKNEVIIKLTKNGKMVVYEVNDLHELGEEEYKLIYQ